MIDRGYVALHRKVRTKKWWYHSVTRMVFTELLINVTWKPYRFGNIDLEPGQWAFKRPELAKKLGLQLHSLNRSLLSLQKDHVCTYEKADNQTLITLVKWQDYQVLNDSQSGQDVPTSVPTNVPTGVPTNVPTDVPTFKEQEKRTKKKEVNYSENFERFWQAYPRKIGKTKAAQLFGKIDFNEFDLIDKAKEYARYCEANGTESRYIKHPSTWLNQSCYLDDFVIEHNHKSNEISHDEIIARVKAARANVI